MAILERSVAASADDCRIKWTGAAWSFHLLTVTAMAVGYEAANNLNVGGGMRFLNVTIPNGTPITAAYLQFKGHLSARSDVVVNSLIVGELGDSAAFSDLADYQARRGTVVGGANDDNNTLGLFPAVSVAWNNIPPWANNQYDADTRSPEIKTVIQAIVDDAGWASGHDMTLFWDDHDGNSDAENSHSRYASSWNDGDVPPLLHIEYIVPGVGRSRGFIIG